MCTALSVNADNHYFGRTLDWIYSYSEKIVVIPRNFLFSLRHAGHLSRHYAIIGSAVVQAGVPLLFDAANEKGLAGAGLNFPKNAFYNELADEKSNIASFEVIPWVLGQCASVKEAKVILEKINITNTSFNEYYPASPLHWIFSDKDSSITVEQTENGLQIYDNPFGVLTNNPPFSYHIHNIANYMSLTKGEPENNFSEKFNLTPYSFGMGAFGLPGDFSSASRFVRAAFLKENSHFTGNEEKDVSQVFHIMASVEQPRGCSQMNKESEYTIYTACINTDKGIYYHKTYYCDEIYAVDMNKCDLDGNTLSVFPFVNESKISYQN